jgi:hypothetical protein
MARAISSAILVIASFGLSGVTIPSAFAAPNPSAIFLGRTTMTETIPSEIRNKPGRIKPAPQPSTAPPQPTNYRVKMWFTVQNSNDGAFDNTIECYGELRIDGDLYWQIPRSAADNNQREAPQTLEISNSPYALKQFIFNKPTIDYAISLRDADGGSADDDVYQGSRNNLNLAAMAGKGEYLYTFINERTFEKSTLHIRVESN